ncbi:MAG TPA: class I tRNA ligase family protein, partial [Rhabdochlamydiaceae bacterium]|nr:class I tRNA ligase family protein [Rhabdochlamydiaceae bacterium]
DLHFKWEKMSKSKGNIIDPIEIIDTYGTDAMRMGLCASATHARQIDLDRRRFEEFKNFINKIWNGARFVFMNIESLSAEEFAQGLDPSQLGLEDRWILSLLNRTIRDVNQHLQDYAFDRAAMTAYDFFWKEFCAYYVELVKPILFGKLGTPQQKSTKQKILTIILSNSLRLMHPMAPFITEELFQMLKNTFQQLHLSEKVDPYTSETIKALLAPACIVAPYPEVISAEDIKPKIEEAFAFINEVIYAVRNIRAEMQLPPNVATDLYIQSPAKDAQRILIEQNVAFIQALARTQSIIFTEVEKALRFSANAIVGNLKLIIPLPEEMREKEKVRLVKEKEKLVQQQNSLRQQLSNQEFVLKAPPQLVEKIKDGLAQAEKGLAEVIKKLEELM